MIIWIVGLSGAGKTTLASEVAVVARRAGAPVCLVDGDTMRAVFGDDLGHGLDDRRRNAERIVRTCLWLEGQGIPVVCAILSLFPEHRAALRDKAAGYHEVFVDAPMTALRARDGKGLYAAADRGEITDVAGVDLPFPRPQSPDLHIVNDSDVAALLSHAVPLAELLGRPA